MFSLSATELAMHENLMTCVIFGTENVVRVSNGTTDVTAEIICIKPNVFHRVFIPDGGADVLYLDAVKLHHNFANFEALSRDWSNIPEDFKNGDHNAIAAFRDFLDTEKVAPTRHIFDVIEELYSTPLNRMTQDELALNLGLERTQALKYFKSVTGQTFRRFKKWAASVTVTSFVFDGQVIGQAGMDAGFSDAAHTSRTVKELFGLTPTDGVKSLRGIATLVR
jgi:AraC-like DNA-binding protein